MALKLYDSTKLQALADSIKSKANTTSKYTIDGLKTLVDGLKTVFTTEAKTVTPTESTQTITPTSADGLSKVTVNPISSTYVGSGVTRYTETTITPTTSSQTAVPANTYVEEDVTVDAILISDITNSIINGSTNVKSTGDSIDSFTVSVSVPEGYHTSQTLTKTFDNILPELESDATNEMILNGYGAYDDAGHLLTGTMTNNGSVNQVLDGSKTTYTIAKGYHNGTGTVSHTTVDIPNPTISVSSSGLITASGNWTAGYTTDTSYSNTKQLSTVAANTITPSTTDIVIQSGQYLTGAQTIKGDENLTAENIASGKSIFGVDGTFTSDATATADDIVRYQTAYVNGEKINGNMINFNSRLFEITSASLAMDVVQFTCAPATSANGYLKIGSSIRLEPFGSDPNVATSSDVISGKRFVGYDGSGVGMLELITIHTGTSDPSSSLGSDGDIYLKI